MVMILATIGSKNVYMVVVDYNRYYLCRIRIFFEVRKYTKMMNME